METKNGVKMAGFPLGVKQKNIVDKAGCTWIALSVDDEQLAVLQLIVPRGRISFPCPHLVVDKQGKNWLLRPQTPDFLLESGKNSGATSRLTGNTETQESVRKKIGQKSVLSTEMRTQRSKDDGFKASLPGGGIGAHSGGFSLADKLDATTVRSAEAAGRIINTTPKLAGKPKTAAARSIIPQNNPVIVDRHPLTPASSFAPQPYPKKLAPAPPEKFPASQAAKVPVSANETFLVKPAWVRFKEKARNKSVAESAEAAGAKDMEILADPPPAWRLWLRRLLPTVSVALLALGTWQLAGGY